jgi:hypothetical protein
MRNKDRQVTCVVHNHTMAHTSYVLLLVEQSMNCAQKYFPGPRPIGSQHVVTPWPSSLDVWSIHILNTLQKN